MIEQVNAQFPESGKARFAFIGEAPGDTEVMTGVPLTGPSGKLFDQTLHAADIDRRECLVTNVLDFKLRDNDISTVCGPRHSMEGSFAAWADKAVDTGAYLPESTINAQLGRLRTELEATQPDVIVPMGGPACWAMLAIQGHGVIKKIRGTKQAGVLFNRPCLPTFHPAFVLRSYHLYSMLLSDFNKARQLAEGSLPDATFEVWDIERPEDFDRLIAKLTPPIAVDIETVKHAFIDCVGFSDAHAGFCASIFNNKTFAPYWSEEDELELRKRVCRLLASDVPKIFQNGGCYDLQMLWECWRTPTRGYVADTRILHKSLFPELPADLASMASLHTLLPSWKPLKGAEDKKNA